MGRFSRQKGKRGERQIVQLLQPVLDDVYGRLRQEYPNRVAELQTPRLQRNQLQSDGGGCDLCGLRWMAAEVKLREKENVVAAWAQACKQARQGQEPFLFYRRNGAEWKVRLWAGRYVEANQWWFAPADVSMVDFLGYFALRVHGEAMKSLFNVGGLQ